MIKRWETPRIAVEKFEANEYVAACWSVGCIVGDGDYGRYGRGDRWRQWNGDEPYGGDCHNHTGSCSHAVNNQFNVDADGRVSFYAENSSDQGSLNGGYTSYIDRDNNGQISDGDLIFWYTLSGNGDRRWNHYGEVEGAPAAHPNRS